MVVVLESQRVNRWIDPQALAYCNSLSRILHLPRWVLGFFFLGQLLLDIVFEVVVVVVGACKEIFLTLWGRFWLRRSFRGLLLWALGHFESLCLFPLDLIEETLGFVNFLLYALTRRHLAWGAKGGSFIDFLGNLAGNRVDLHWTRRLIELGPLHRCPALRAAWQHRFDQLDEDRLVGLKGRAEPHLLAELSAVFSLSLQICLGSKHC